MIQLTLLLGLVNSMNKRGFTLIELITTFALSTVIIILLINIILVIKDIYTSNNIESELLIEQSNLSNLINKRLIEDSLDRYESCSDSEFCYNFVFIDGTTSKLVVGEDFIRFDNYTYKIKKNTKIENPTIETIIDIEVSNTNSNNSFLVINIPIIYKLTPNKNYGISIVYQYNSNYTEL